MATSETGEPQGEADEHHLLVPRPEQGPAAGKSQGKRKEVDLAVSPKAPSGGLSGTAKRLPNRPLSVSHSLLEETVWTLNLFYKWQFIAAQTLRPELKSSALGEGNKVFIWETQVLLIHHGDLEIWSFGVLELKRHPQS